MLDLECERLASAVSLAFEPEKVHPPPGLEHRLVLMADNEGNGAARLRLTGGRLVLLRREESREAELFILWYSEHALDLAPMACGLVRPPSDIVPRTPRPRLG